MQQRGGKIPDEGGLKAKISRRSLPSRRVIIIIVPAPSRAGEDLSDMDQEVLAHGHELIAGQEVPPGL